MRGCVGEMGGGEGGLGVVFFKNLIKRKYTKKEMINYDFCPFYSKLYFATELNFSSVYVFNTYRYTACNCIVSSCRFVFILLIPFLYRAL